MAISKETHEWINKILKLGNVAVTNAQKENLANGIPNVFSKNGEKYYQMPDGTYTKEVPQIFSSKL
jgi:hypothetical protein